MTTAAPRRGAAESTASAASTAPVSAEQNERRRRIIDAAFELGVERGYDAVQMRDVSAIANVSLATIYRYFSSKDHLLAAAMTEWTAKLQVRVAKSPPTGTTPADQLTDVLSRACRAMARQPKLSAALVRALSSADPGVQQSAAAVQLQIEAMAAGILVGLDPAVRSDVMAVLGHVWYSALVGWANGRSDFDTVIAELDRAVHVLVDPHT
jgi:TetR/AcrR family transcriptional regulator, cholesterol catabolism regulator